MNTGISEIDDLNRSGGSQHRGEGRVTAKQILLRGCVQGIGIRPTIVRMARHNRVSGWVQNTSDGVLMQLEGSPHQVHGFRQQLAAELLAGSEIQIAVERIVPVAGCDDFRITMSAEAGALATSVPPDLAMCPQCAGEINDPADRRFGYALSSCVNCGPRYSIIDNMPYERCQTSMAAFDLCVACAREYSSSHDRRFHAQTIACADCGPRLWFESCSQGRVEDSAAAIAAAVQIIRSGGILALKGLGGYQLLCDASSEFAVQQLRNRKCRPSKPFAVMVDSLAAVAGRLTEIDRNALLCAANPIVIIDSVALQELNVAASVSPRLNSLGIFLPATPLHALLLQKLGRPLVVTSGNIDSEPLEFDEQTAAQQLKDVADGWLHHDRMIKRTVDDSVVRVMCHQPVTLRVGRGLALMVLPVQTKCSALALGAHQKVAIALCSEHQAVLGPHLGDMDSVACRRRFTEHVAALSALYDVTPVVIAHDLHPDYFTTRWALDSGKPTIAVQHHHAHIVAGMLDGGLLEERVLGVAFDGSGYGTDGTIWGGEFLIASKQDFQRVASLTEFILPGGELAIREPWRTAVALLSAAMPWMSAEQVFQLMQIQAARCGQSVERPDTELLTVTKISQVQTLVRAGVGLRTTSMGRLFDGVASILTGVTHADFEGQPAMQLEALSDQSSAASKARHGHRITGEAHGTDSLIRVDWRTLVRQLVDDIRSGKPAESLAMGFHHAMAASVADVADQFPQYPIVLSGGCFQNRRLTELVVQELQQRSRQVCSPSRISPNDGGLAAGQLAIAVARTEFDAEREKA